MKWDLHYFQTGEWQVVDERLADLTAAKLPFCPSRKNLFKALELVPFEDVRVMIMGQDPYPDPGMATGVAFSIPPSEKRIPPTLANIFKEYVDDLHYSAPINGDLSPWCKQGVLLWNAIPSCEAFKSMTHYHWSEWHPLTQEIVTKLSAKGTVLVFLGAVAREFAKFANSETSNIFEFSHPSPRGSLNSKTPFVGSRMFSTINASLNDIGHEVIDWRL